MSVLKNLAVFCACMFGLALLVSVFLPPAWEVSRDVTIQAEPREVHRVLADLDSWREWSPWGIMVDPAVEMTAEGTSLKWSGPDVGTGSLAVTSAEPKEGLWCDVALRGAPVKSALQYRRNDGGSTNVAWTVRGEVGSNPLGRYTVLFRRYTVGPELVSALTRVKSKIERGF